MADLCLAVVRRVALPSTGGKRQAARALTRLEPLASPLLGYVDELVIALAASSSDRRVRATIDGLGRRLEMHLSDGRRGERLRDGVRVVVVGRPNAGKSSLVNWLCRRPLAIVSPIAGTTRDSLDTHINLSGHPIIVTDTAGLRQSVDPIEQEGVRRTREGAKTADVLVVLVDAAQLVGSNAQDEVMRVLQESGAFEKDVADARILAVVNKIDTNPIPDQDSITAPSGERIPLVAVSCKTEDGLTAFISTLTRLASSICSVNQYSASPTFSRVRQRKLVEEALNELRDFEPLLGVDVSVAAQKLRNATHAIGMIVGSVCTEELLDAIFRDFCIGK
uniref:TrmE-type G domain-containing protein n=1 Tax=Plectus sambesii TaxID=2011161 RepID=A0A914XGD0_9BILA